MICSFCVHAGKLDICQVNKADLPDGRLRRVPKRYSDTDWAIPEGKRLLLAQPHVVLRWARIEVAPGSVTLLGEAWEGHEPPPGADMTDEVLNQRLKDCINHWPAEHVEIAQRLNVATLREAFSTGDEATIQERLRAAIGEASAR